MGFLYLLFPSFQRTQLGVGICVYPFLLGGGNTAGSARCCPWLCTQVVLCIWDARNKIRVGRVKGKSLPAVPPPWPYVHLSCPMFRSVGLALVFHIDFQTPLHCFLSLFSLVLLHFLLSLLSSLQIPQTQNSSLHFGVFNSVHSHTHGSFLTPNWPESFSLLPHLRY